MAGEEWREWWSNRKRWIAHEEYQAELDELLEAVRANRA